MKKFIEERKRSAMRHSRQIESLKKLHAEQTDKFDKDSEKVETTEKNTHLHKVS